MSPPSAEPCQGIITVAFGVHAWNRLWVCGEVKSWDGWAWDGRANEAVGMMVGERLVEGRELRDERG